MELSNMNEYELTLEDILSLHRHWITKLYIEDKKTAFEIVEILHEHRLQATLTQVRSCIRKWNLVLPDPEPESPIFAPLPHASQTTPDITISMAASVSIRSDRSFSSDTSYAPSDPDIAVLYTYKPLPPLPDVKHNDSKVRKQRSSGNGNERIRLTCHHGPLLSDVHEVQTSLDSIPRALGVEMGLGLTTLEMYTGVEQNHERVAVGLQREQAYEFSRVRYKRAGDSAEERKMPRVRKGAQVVKRKAVVGRGEGAAKRNEQEKESEKGKQTEKGKGKEITDEEMESG